MNKFASPANDQIGMKISEILQTPGKLRDDLTTPGVYLPAGDQQGLGMLDDVFLKSFEAKGIIRKIRKAIKDGKIPKNKPERSLDEAL